MKLGFVGYCGSRGLVCKGYATRLLIEYLASHAGRCKGDIRVIAATREVVEAKAEQYYGGFGAVAVLRAFDLALCEINEDADLTAPKENASLPLVNRYETSYHDSSRLNTGLLATAEDLGHRSTDTVWRPSNGLSRSRKGCATKGVHNQSPGVDSATLFRAIRLPTHAGMRRRATFANPAEQHTKLIAEGFPTEKRASE